DDGHDVFLEIAADVAEPFGEIRRGGAEAGGTFAATRLTLPFAFALVVNRGERFVHGHLLRGKLAAAATAHLREGFLRVAAEDQAPAFDLFLVGGAHIRVSAKKRFRIGTESEDSDT